VARPRTGERGLFGTRVTVVDAQRHGSADGLLSHDTRDDLDAISFQLHARTTAVPPLPARHLFVDLIRMDAQPRRQAFHDGR